MPADPLFDSSSLCFIWSFFCVFLFPSLPFLRPTSPFLASSWVLILFVTHHHENVTRSNVHSNDWGLMVLLQFNGKAVGCETVRERQKTDRFFCSWTDEKRDDMRRSMLLEQICSSSILKETSIASPKCPNSSFSSALSFLSLQLLLLLSFSSLLLFFRLFLTQICCWLSIFSSSSSSARCSFLSVFSPCRFLSASVLFLSNINKSHSPCCFLSCSSSLSLSLSTFGVSPPPGSLPCCCVAGSFLPNPSSMPSPLLHVFLLFLG